MNDDRVTTLFDRLAEDLPHSTVPPDLRLEGERRLRRRRAARGGAVVAVGAIVGAIAVGAAFTGRGSDLVGPAATESPGTGQGGTGLSVVFADDPAAPDRGTAWWDSQRRELVYIGLRYYSGSCLAVGSAAMTGSTVRLTVKDGDAYSKTGCTADAVVVRATISGLTARPANLLVTEGRGGPRTVEIGSEVPDLQVPPQLATSDWAGGTRMEARLEGRLTVEESGCLTLGGDTPVWWPKGSSIYLDDAGEAVVVVLLDPSGVEVAREGDDMALGGGYVPGPNNGSPCVGGAAEVFLVQDELNQMPASRGG